MHLTVQGQPLCCYAPTPCRGAVGYVGKVVRNAALWQLLRATVVCFRTAALQHAKLVSSGQSIAGTVEERILELQERKRGIIAAAFGDNAGASQQATRLTKEDLHFLFTGQ